VKEREPSRAEVAPEAERAAASAPSTVAERLLLLQGQAGNAAVGRAVVARLGSGIEVPSARAGDRSLRHLRHSGVAFVRGAGEDASGVNAYDVVQGAIGDCFFLSPLMSVARLNPGRIARMIRGPVGQTAVGANIYEVTLYVPEDGDWEPRTFRLDDRFPSDASGRPVYAQYGDMSGQGPELWVMLMEKAWAAARGSYENIHFGSAADGLRALTGEDSDWTRVADRDSDDILDDIEDALDDGQPVICNTFQTLSTAALTRATQLGVTLTAAHSYNAAWASEEDGRLNIANPHGRNHLWNLAIADFKLFFEWYCILDESVR
jgi:hypothetical protein